MEEDIKIIQNQILEFNQTKEFANEFQVRFYKSLENLLTRYKQMKIENQSYIDYFGNPPCYDDAKYIPKSKVKERIETLRESIKYAKDDGFWHTERTKGAITVLQELSREE